jgi:HAD superfamily phosphoserine phosphatase-like hydrolase
MSKPRLIVFDVEGVLIPKRRYLLFEASRRLSFWKLIRIFGAGFLYEIGLISLDSALRTIFRQFRGLALSDLYQLYKKIPLISGVQEVFEKLREKGYKTALISSGIPQPFVEDLSSQLGADYAVGLSLEVANGHLTGNIGGDVTQAGGKALALKKLVEKEGLTTNDCTLVADDRNNLSMFQLCSVRIGYNPDFLLSARSDVVIKGSFSDIFPLLTGEKPQSRKSHSFSRQDLIRATIHMGGFFIPIASLYLLNRYAIAFLIFLATLLYITSEFARMEGRHLPITSMITLNAANKSEINEFITAPIFYATGIMMALILFSEPVGYASIAILTLGDGFAELVGRKIGIHSYPYNKGKSLEGSIFGFIVASMGASLFVSPLKALLGAVIGMFVESLPTPVNDNLTIPLVSGLVMSLIP